MSAITDGASAVSKAICAFPFCREPLSTHHGNAVYHSSMCRNRAFRLRQHGEVIIECPRCGRRDYVITLEDGDCCMRCGYADGDPLSLDGVTIINSPGGRPRKVVADEVDA